MKNSDLFKGNAPKIIDILKKQNLNPLKIIYTENVYNMKIDGENYQLTPDLLSFEYSQETVRGEKVYPNIEPSYELTTLLILCCFTAPTG